LIPDSFRLGDVVSGSGVVGAAQSVVELRLEADPAGAPEGSFAGLSPVPDTGNLPPGWSAPAPRANGFRVVQVDASDAPGAAAAPDLAVEIEQRGRVVFRSPDSPGRLRAGAGSSGARRRPPPAAATPRTPRSGAPRGGPDRVT
jgi:hypothetical protein